MPTTFRLNDKSVSLHVNDRWSVLYLKQFVCLELACDPHTHFLSHQGSQLIDWERVSNYDFLLVDNTPIDVLPHANINHFYVLCYSCDNVTPAVFVAVCDKCDSSNFKISSPIANPNIKNVNGFCEDCQFASGHVSVNCSKDASHSPAIFLKQVRRNLDHMMCIGCYSETSEIIVSFCENPGHVLCLDCFRRYAESYLSNGHFVMVQGIGYTISCPVACPDSYISDTHLFRILGASFYSHYKELAARNFCHTEGYFTCSNCGMFWERPNLNFRNNWFTCEKPYGCGVEFCSRCKNIVIGEGNASTCTCGHEEVTEGQTPSSGLSFRGISGTWDGVKLTPLDLASRSLIALTCKTCPRCNSQTNKDGGCNHISCTICGFQWCWICHSDWSKACQSNHWF